MSLAFVGTGLALLLLGAFAGALRVVWRAPFRALGVLVAGMALHNILIMLLLSLQTPSMLIRIVQFWKEGILLLLAGLAARKAWQAWRDKSLPQLIPFDALALAFALLVCIYFLIPQQIFPTEGTMGQRLVSLRTALLLPTLYAFGRVFWSMRREDFAWVAKAILGAAGIVGLFGLFELWFVPTSAWVDWGANLFSSWLGFAYRGPGGLPENFVHSAGVNLALRRMVSTYISPLGIAYTGLLVVPLGAALLAMRHKERSLPRWFLWVAFILLIAGILFSVTRGALLSTVGAMVLLALLIPRWRMVTVGAATILAVLLVLYEYVNVGPLVTADLKNVRPPAGYVIVRNAWSSISGSASPTEDSGRSTADLTSSGELLERTVSAEDPSAKGHIAALGYGLQYTWQHPFGTGLGSSTFRYGESQGGPPESAIFAFFGEMGAIGGILYLAMYLLAIYYGFRAFWRTRSDLLRAAFFLVPAVGGLALLPITLTSAVWGNFSVTFLFWWCAGLSATTARIPKLDSASLSLAPDKASQAA